MILSRRPSRRTVLLGAAGAALSLPFLESPLGKPANAQATAPKRLVIMYTTSGMVLKNWTPSQFGASFPLSPILMPFDTPALRPKLTVLSGIEMSSAGTANTHAVGMANLLTCRSTGGGKTYGVGISIDQEIARQLAGVAPIPSVQLGVQSQDYGNYYDYLSYGEGGGSQNAIAADDRPSNVYASLFSNVADNPDNQAQLQRGVDQRKSVLDLVAKDLTRLHGKLGAADQARLDQHSTLLRELEGRIGVGTTCTKPAAPQIDEDNVPQVCKAQIDLLATAFACDLTRVATLQIGAAQGNMDLEPMLGSDAPGRGHHVATHGTSPFDNDNPSSGQITANNHITRMNTWCAEQLAYLGTKLSQIDDGGGKTALDNTAILWVTEVSEGSNHQFSDMPFLLLGDLGGALKAGEHFNLAGRSHSDLFVSLGLAMGLPNFNTFGDAEFCTGPIADIMA